MQKIRNIRSTNQYGGGIVRWSTERRETIAGMRILPALSRIVAAAMPKEK
jgi:hypothetical protein